MIYDADADTVTLSGRNGEFDVVPVTENGITVHLSLSNQSLLRQLRPLNGKHTLKITRSGSSYDTKYQVEDLGVPTAQAGLKK